MSIEELAHLMADEVFQPSKQPPAPSSVVPFLHVFLRQLTGQREHSAQLAAPPSHQDGASTVSSQWPSIYD